MDTRKEYIDMCKKAEHEIQSLWKVKHGDFFLSNEGIRTIGFDWINAKSYYEQGLHIIRFAMTKKMDLEMGMDKDIEYPCTVSFKHGEYEIKTFSGAIWLPRQDQLQEMLRNKLSYKSNHWHIAFHFYDFLNGQYIKPTKQCAFIILTNILNKEISMEQLWLAFIMKEKYNKIWHNKDWQRI